MYLVIQVFTNQEDEIINLLKEKISSDILIDAFYPMRKMLKNFKGVRKPVEEKCFPGYIFVETEKPTELYVSLYKIPKFTKLLGKEKNEEIYMPLTPTECRMIDMLCGKENNRVIEISDVTIQEGKIAKVISGPLVGNEGIITKVNLHKRRVKILLDFLGGKREFEVGINMVTSN